MTKDEIINILKIALIDIRDNNFLTSDTNGKAITLQPHEIAKIALDKIGEIPYYIKLRNSK